MELKYIGTYKVVRIYQRSRKSQLIEKGLSLEDAKRLVNSFPDSVFSMVVFKKQFSASKYFVPITHKIE